MKNDHKYLKLLILLLLASTFHATGAAQTAPQTKRTPTIKPHAASMAVPSQKAPAPARKDSPPPLSLTPFPAAMLEAGKIDPAYSGHDPSAIFTALEAAVNIKKGEFESSAEFEERRTKSLSTPYLPGLQLTDQLGFVVEVRKVGKYFAGIGYGYDADTAEASLYVILADSVPNEIGSPNYDTSTSGFARRQARSPLKVHLLHSQKIIEREYQASNAYGATVAVTESAYKTVQLGFDRLDFVPLQKAYSESPQPVTRVKMEAAVASRELPRLKALFLVRPSPPFVDYDHHYKEPTRDRPDEVSIQKRIIRAIADEIVFYSGITGEIIYRAKQN